MGFGRLIFLVLLTAMGTVCYVHRSSRAWVKDVLSDLRLRMSVATADDLYRLAERQYAAGDFEKAELSCDMALKLVPHDAPVAALRTELGFILGHGVATPANNGDYSKFICTPQVFIGIGDIDNLLEKGDRFAIFGDREGAKNSFRKVLEFVKWMPSSEALSQRCERARFGLTHVSPPTAEK